MMQRFNLCVVLLFVLASFMYACGETTTEEAPEDKTPEGATNDKNLGDIATEQPVSAGAVTPEVMPGDVLTSMPGDGATSTTTAEGNFLIVFLEAVITNDTEAVKAHCTGELTENIDKIVADLGFREFVEDGDYIAVWDKLKSVSQITTTGGGGTMSVGFWNVPEAASGMKEFAVQFEMIIEGDDFKVSNYTVMTP